MVYLMENQKNLTVLQDLVYNSQQIFIIEEILILIQLDMIDCGDGNNWIFDEYSRIHRDIDIIKAMK